MASPELELVRLMPEYSTEHSHGSGGEAIWDPNHPFHLALCTATGILRTYVMETRGGGIQPHLSLCAQFQLHLSYCSHWQMSAPVDCGNDGLEARPGLVALALPWGSLSFIPSRPNEIVFFQAGSPRILLARLPGGSPRPLCFGRFEARSWWKGGDGACAMGGRGSGAVPVADVPLLRTTVSCMGQQSAPLVCMAVRDDGVAMAAAAADGSLCIWRLLDGVLLAKQASELLPWGFQSRDEYSGSRLMFYGRVGMAVGCGNGEVKMWEVKDSTPSLHLRSVPDVSLHSPVSALAFHFPAAALDDRGVEALVAAGSRVGGLGVWRFDETLCEFDLVHSVYFEATASVVGLCFRSDGSILAAGVSYDGASRALASSCRDIIVVYDTESWVSLASIELKSKLISCLFYRPPSYEKSVESGRSPCWELSAGILLVGTWDGPEAHLLSFHRNQKVEAAGGTTVQLGQGHECSGRGFMRGEEEDAKSGCRKLIGADQSMTSGMAVRSHKRQVSLTVQENLCAPRYHRGNNLSGKENSRGDLSGFESLCEVPCVPRRKTCRTRIPLQSVHTNTPQSYQRTQPAPGPARGKASHQPQQKYDPSFPRGGDRTRQHFASNFQHCRDTRVSRDPPPSTETCQRSIGHQFRSGLDRRKTATFTNSQRGVVGGGRGVGGAPESATGLNLPEVNASVEYGDVLVDVEKECSQSVTALRALVSHDLHNRTNASLKDVSGGNCPSETARQYRHLCSVSDVPNACVVAPRMIGKQVQRQWLVAKERRPSLSDLWGSSNRSPEVSAAEPGGTGRHLGASCPFRKEAQLQRQRESSCRAAQRSMALAHLYLFQDAMVPSFMARRICACYGANWSTAYLDHLSKHKFYLGVCHATTYMYIQYVFQGCDVCQLAWKFPGHFEGISLVLYQPQKWTV